MPRLPVDGKKVIEHRITLGGKERMLLADLATSYRIDAISGNDSVVEVLGDGTKVIAALGTLGAILELLGITDIFDFDDALKGEVMEVKEKVKEKAKEKATDPQFLFELWKAVTPAGAVVRAQEAGVDWVGDRI
jgi:hypothetical protein